MNPTKEITMPEITESLPTCVYGFVVRPGIPDVCGCDTHRQMAKQTPPQEARPTDRSGP